MAGTAAEHRRQQQVEQRHQRQEQYQQAEQQQAAAASTKYGELLAGIGQPGQRGGQQEADVQVGQRQQQEYTVVERNQQADQDRSGNAQPGCQAEAGGTPQRDPFAGGRCQSRVALADLFLQLSEQADAQAQADAEDDAGGVQGDEEQRGIADEIERQLRQSCQAVEGRQRIEVRATAAGLDQRAAGDQGEVGQVAASVAAASDWRYQRRMRSMQESGGGGATRIAPLGRPAGGNDKGRPEAALVRSD